MLSCPNCNSRLSRQSTKQGVVFLCSQCGGVAAGLPVLRKDARSKDFLKGLWYRTRTNPVLSKRKCPHCDRPMTLVTLPVGSEREPLALDVCSLCQYVWFDHEEYSRVPKSAEAAEQAERELSPEAKRRLAEIQVEHAKDGGGLYPQDDSPPDGFWKFLPAILGMPVEYDVNPVAKRPILTWTITAVTVLVFLASRIDLEAAVRELGFVPAEWTRYAGLTLLTSFFLHGGWFHLLSNMYFFVVFGDNVEDRLGKLRFALLIAASHLAGTLLHGLLDPRGEIPCVGASAGISGVLAYYAIAFPRARLGFLFIFFYIPRWIRMPAIVALVLYFLLQIFGAWQQVTGFGNVSNLGHLGGLVVGILAGIWVRLERSDTREPSPSAVIRARRG